MNTWRKSWLSCRTFAFNNFSTKNSNSGCPDLHRPEHSSDWVFSYFERPPLKGTCAGDSVQDNLQFKLKFVVPPFKLQEIWGRFWMEICIWILSKTGFLEQSGWKITKPFITTCQFWRSFIKKIISNDLISPEAYISWSLKGGTTDFGLNWRLSCTESTAQAPFNGGRSK